MRDSERYMAQADAVMRMAGRAASAAEREVYETIAEGWRKLAREARRNEQHEEKADNDGAQDDRAQDDRAQDDRSRGEWAYLAGLAKAPRRAHGA